MIDIKKQSIELERTGVIVHVSNDPIAKLMYYLDCINCLTDYYIPNYVHNYKNRKSLSFEQENNVLLNASVLCPSLFIGKIIFNIPSLCPIADNQLYNISEIKSRLKITPELVISGKIARTVKIMTYKNRWIESNYYSPIKLYSKRIEAIKNGTVERYRPKNSNIHKNNNPYNYYHKPRPQSVQRKDHFNDKKPYNNYNHRQSNNYYKPINNHINNPRPYNNHYQKPKIHVHPRPNNNYNKNHQQFNNNYKPRPQSVQRQRYQNITGNQNIYIININVQNQPKPNEKSKIEKNNQVEKQQKEINHSNSKQTPQKESMSNSKTVTTNDDSSNNSDGNVKSNKPSKLCLLI